MFKSLVLSVLLLIASVLQARQNALADKQQKVLDSVQHLVSKQWLTDSLSIIGWGDSLRQHITGQAAKKANQLNQKIDSLNQLQLPTEKYTRKLDSIQQKSNQLLVEINQKQQQMLGKTKVNLGQWQDKLKLSVGQGLNLPSADLKIPELGALDFQVLELSPELSALNKKLPFGQLDGLGQWKSKLPDLGVNVPALKDFKTNPDKYRQLLFSHRFSNKLRATVHLQLAVNLFDMIADSVNRY